MIDIMNLSNGKVYTYDSKDPKEALAICFEQVVKNNYNTWEYDLNSLDIKESMLCYYIGDLATFKDCRRMK